MNSANHTTQQNIVAVQYQGDIWYRVSVDIPDGGELLTYYGDDYSKTMGILEGFRRDLTDEKREEKVTEEKEEVEGNDDKEEKEKAFVCGGCGFCWVTKDGLDHHRCQAGKEAKKHYEKVFDCNMCDKSFGQKWHLNLISTRV